VKTKAKRRKRHAPPIQKANAAMSAPATEATLRQNLRLKLGYNELAIDRLIQLEREKLPDASLQTLMEAAIERWERENR
jgi:hypothetical protein